MDEELTQIERKNNENKEKIKPFKLSEESAKKEFERFLNHYDFDFEDIVSDRGKDGAEQLQRKMIRAIRSGTIEFKESSNIEEGLQVIQRTKRGVVVIYNEYNSTAAIESDKARNVAESYYKLLGSLCGKGEDFIKNKQNFSVSDLKLSECLAILFLMQ